MLCQARRPCRPWSPIPRRPRSGEKLIEQIRVLQAPEAPQASKELLEECRTATPQAERSRWRSPPGSWAYLTRRSGLSSRPCHLRRRPAVSSAARARWVAEYGRLDMAFNNAGIQVPPSDAADEPIEHFERVTAVNQRGVWACMKHELRVMREQGSGAIVNCSSLGGLVGLPQRAAYHGTKHAVLGMTKSAGVEYAPRGIRINAVCPGTIDTPMVADMLEGQAEAMAEIMKQQSIGRLGRAEEVAAAVLWLCSPAASFVVGVGLPVDGGFTAH